MTFNPEQDNLRGGNIPARMALFWKAQRFFGEHLTEVRNSDVPRLSQLETMDVTAAPLPTSLLSADSIAVKSVNGFRNVSDQIEGTLEFEVNLTQDGSPYDPLLERLGEEADIPVILVGPEMPPCFTGAGLVQEHTLGYADSFPRVELSNEDSAEFERILGQLQVITDPNHYDL